MLRIRLASPHVPAPSGAGECEAFRRATAVADHAFFWRDTLLARSGLRWRRTSAASVQMRTLLWDVSAVMYPVFCSVTAPGLLRRPAALGLLLRIPRPSGVTVPPKTSLQTTARSAVQTSFGPTPRKQTFDLGSRAHSLGFARCDPSNNGKIQQTETRLCTRTK